MSGTPVGTNRLSYLKQKFSETDEEGLEVEKMNTLLLLPQVRQFPYLQSVVMKMSIICGTRCWSDSFMCRLACAWRWLVDEFATA